MGTRMYIGITAKYVGTHAEDICARYTWTHMLIYVILLV